MAAKDYRSVLEEYGYASNMGNTPSVVAVINSSPDTVDLLRTWLEHAGFVVVSAFTWDVRDGQVDIERFVRQHDPEVIVYDWRLCEHVRQMPVMQGRAFVLTSTNAGQLQRLIDPGQPVMEIIGKPYDLDLLLAAVKSARPRSGT
jgi:CheY-like chemotaxis protein